MRCLLVIGAQLYTLSAIVVAYLFYLVFKTSRRNNISLGINAVTFLVSILLILALAYLDGKYKSLLGNYFSGAKLAF